jgi:hypothetical protein
MTEQEAKDAIRNWVAYSRFGAIDEPDFGDGMPTGYKAIGLESQYRSPQMWHPPEARTLPDVMRDDHARIESVFLSLPSGDKFHVTQWYFGQRDPIGHRTAQQRFKAAVMRIGEEAAA